MIRFWSCSGSWASSRLTGAVGDARWEMAAPVREGHLYWQAKLNYITDISLFNIHLQRVALCPGLSRAAAVATKAANTTVRCLIVRIQWSCWWGARQETKAVVKRGVPFALCHHNHILLGSWVKSNHRIFVQYSVYDASGLIYNLRLIIKEFQRSKKNREIFSNNKQE